MLKLHQLPKSTSPSHKRRGQGYGSGKGGHTSGRGQKGQLSRSRLPLWFEGGQLPQIRRFPFIRGKSRFDRLRPRPIILNLTDLNRFPSGTVVTPKTLLAARLVSQTELASHPIKILGQGTLKSALTVSLPT